MKFMLIVDAAQLEQNPAVLQPVSIEQSGLEIRMDGCTRMPDFQTLCTDWACPLLATYRSKPHLGKANPQDRDGIGWDWRMAAAHIGFEFVDLELDEPNLADKIARLQDLGVKVILSHHDLQGSRSLPAAFEKAAATQADVVKIIGNGQSIADFQFQRDAYRQWGERPLVHFFMGGDFWASRILSMLYGAPFTYAAEGAGPPPAPGLLTRDQILGLMGTPAVSLEQMALFGVIGAPIGHSKSPAFHDHLLKAQDPNALFLPFPVANAQQLQQLHTCFPELKGLAVTKPMKEPAFEAADHFLDAGTKAVGAANTLLFRADGLHAGNTDYMAMQKLLADTPSDGVVRILGYGGLGKAVLAAATDLGLKVQVTNRSAARLADIPPSPNLTLLDWDQRCTEGAHTIVQATSVGMAPNHQETPLPHLPKDLSLLIETIYNPEITRLMQQCDAANIKNLNGYQLFNLQAKIQNQRFIEQCAKAR